MATEATAVERRPRREREQEVLVWPDLVFVEFISAVVFTVALVILTAIIDTPLLDRANPDVTPNPSKAPWYLLNLQELLLHMEPGLAGVVVPTVALVGLAAIPYFDRSTEGQGQWFATPNAVKITIASWLFTIVVTVLLIMFDSGKFEEITRWFPGLQGDQGLTGMRSFQTSWEWSIAGLNYPQDFNSIPAPLGIDNINLPGDRKVFLYWNNGEIQLVDFMIEQGIPVAIMVGLSVLLILALHKIGWVLTTRDVMIVLFSGFMAAFMVLTIVGTAFRGEGLELVFPWDVPTHPEGA